MNTATRLLPLVGLVLLGLICACEPPKPLSPAAASFRDMVRREFKIVAQKLGPPLADKSAKMVDQALADYLLGSPWRKIDCDFSLKVISSEFKYVGSRVHVHGWDGSMPGEKLRLDYSRYDNIFADLRHDEIGSATLYDSDGPFMVICAPVHVNGEVVGYFGLMMPDQCMVKQYGIDWKQLAAINFN